ncbi:MAG: ABC-F family ATP-binding cassette domain-containing protein [Ignavibacteriales bacterium]|nr:MAG: ABC-F family ATP-binding cassette domain-containing protein [Ignavibacteriales bacterium]
MLDLSHISLQFSGKYLFNDVSFRINSGDRISLVGANGTGKSSLLKIISGQLLPEDGKINKQKNISIGYLPQENVTHKGRTLIDEAKSALTDAVHLQSKEKEITDHLNLATISDEEREDLINTLGEVHHKLEALNVYSAEANLKKILTGLGFEENDFERVTDEFSGGWQMRIALAKILISQNDILLLDEPTNHLDLDSLKWLISFLKAYKGALLIVSHDKHFINQVTNKTLEIYLARFNIYNGSYDQYLKWKDERDKTALDQYALQQRKIKETQRFIERFRYKSSKARQVQSRVKQLEKIELVELPEDTSKINISFPEPPQSGKTNMILESISKSYSDKKIFENINFQVDRGDKIAFVGPNGAGKSTLAKIIAGVLSFENGKRNEGHNTIISYYAQDVADNLEPDLDIIETVEGIAEDKTLGQLRTLLGSFLFHGDDVFKSIGVLSGGEKSRVALAKILLTKSNFIILDEPTNHLDISSKAVLQKALINFKGSLILVSHDIDFLRPLVNKVVEIRKGIIKNYEGDIDYYLFKKEQEEAGSESNSQKVKQSDDSFSKKEQKRIEAEQRQKKYSASKDIIKKISALESEIEKLESQQNQLENYLSQPEAYGNTVELVNKTNEFNSIKKLLEQKMYEWTVLSEELQRIEDQFN